MSKSWYRNNNGGYPKTRPRRKQRGWFQGPRKPRAYGGGSLSLQQEKKFKDTVVADAVVSATGFISTSLNLVVQGVDEEERIGRKIIIRSISARFEVFLPSLSNIADLDGGDVVRIMIFIDKQANGAMPSVTDILETGHITLSKHLYDYEDSSYYSIFKLFLLLKA